MEDTLEFIPYVMCFNPTLIVLSSVSFTYTDNGINHEAGYWQFLAISGALATPIIGNFDLNPHSKGHIIMHYIGVTMMGLSVFPFGIQQNWSIKGGS